MIHPTRFNAPLFRHLRIGLLGGSFNPAHQGHLEMSLYAMKHLGLDQVWWLVSPQNPLKSSDDMAPLAERVMRANTVISGRLRVIATSIECDFRTRYTIDTLQALQQTFPKTHFVWLMGGDNLQQIPRWRHWERIFLRVPIAVFRRFGYPVGRGLGKAGIRFGSAWHPSSAASHVATKLAPAWVVLGNSFNKLSGTSLRRPGASNPPEQETLKW